MRVVQAPRKSKRFVEFPKAVYHHETGHKVIINSEDERPEGYVSSAEYAAGRPSDAQVDAAVGAVQAAEIAASKKAAEDAAAAKAAAEKAKAEAEAAEKAAIDEERDRIKAFLTEHNVDFAPQLGLPKLQELEEALKAHLAAHQEEPEGDDSD